MDRDASSGSNALQEARARRAANDGAADGAASGGSSDAGIVGPNPGREGGAGTGTAAMGDLLSGSEVLRIQSIGSGRKEALAAAPLHLRGFVLEAYDSLRNLYPTQQD